MSEQAEMRENLNRLGPSIYDIIKQDHEDVRKLFKQVTEMERFDADLYSHIKRELLVHMEAEETFFYPRIENLQETRLITLESYEEHDLGKQIINDIDMSDKTKKDWLYAKIKVLNEAIEMHMKEEETELFDKARKVLSHDDEHQIGRLFQQGKRNAMYQH
ncbi:MAG: hemerythrin domain-containing protein [Candidatus Bathyarchaeia archaeon]